MVFLHPALAHEGLILLILHHTHVFQIQQNSEMHQKVQDISSYSLRAKKWGEAEQTKQQKT